MTQQKKIFPFLYKILSKMCLCQDEEKMKAILNYNYNKEASTLKFK